MVAADVVCLRPSADGEGSEVLLVRRRNEPFRGRWALPGGFVEMDEDLPDAARRELLEETGVEATDLVELGAFGRPGRDPRGRVISVVFMAGIARSAPEPRGADDAAEARWFPLASLPPLAFDHEEIIARARERLGAEPELLPKRRGASRRRKRPR
jgi:8-oxo-dGTP diphosphatase